MGETWYRGEGAGVAPAKPGGHEHDFGDGMYLTDTLSVAEVYAKRRATEPGNQRVYGLTVERQKFGRVLDLTADSRWSAFMMDNKSDKRLMGKSRLDYLRIKQELYGQFFTEFRKKYKISLDDYDAVIGPEYNLGGKQLCILHKNGTPSALTVKIRARFRPAALVQARLKAVGKLVPLGRTGAWLPVRASQVANKLVRVVSARPRGVPAGRGAGVAAAAAIGVLLFEVVMFFIWPRLWEKYVLQPWFKEQMKKWAPEDRSGDRVEGPGDGPAEIPGTEGLCEYLLHDQVAAHFGAQHRDRLCTSHEHSAVPG